MDPEAGLMLTGKVRYRIGWRKRLVLQVEYTTMAAGGPGWVINPGLVNQWRDATLEDMQAIAGGEQGMLMHACKSQMPPQRNSTTPSGGPVVTQVER